MSQQVQSPPRLKKSLASSASSLHKSKLHLPSRYAQAPKHQKSGLQEIFNSIETQVREEGADKQQSPESKLKSISSELASLEARRENKSQFKSKPLKRQENDMVQFKQIFLLPREQTLTQIKKLQRPHDHHKTPTMEWERASKLQKGLQSVTQQSQKIELNPKQYFEALDLLETETHQPVSAQAQLDDFYETQLLMDPPSPGSTLSLVSAAKPPVSSSLPPNYRNCKDLNIKQLLLRAKAGMNSEDIQKEAHLSFYLGEVYADRKIHRQALKSFRRFLGFAKMMEDKLGMAVGANRVGCSYFHCQEFQKSISFHSENLKLSGIQGCFYGLYNIGVCHRKLKKYQQALEYFKSALTWAQENGQEESQCLALGQLGVTYQSMEQFQEAVGKFEQAGKISERIKNGSLRLNSLWNILRISSQLRMKSTQQLQKIALEAFECAKEMQQIGSLDILRCNIGILGGIEAFHQKYAELLHREWEEVQQMDV